jgi:DNA-binding MurR/RpiR family transcriptional regulator
VRTAGTPVDLGRRAAEVRLTPAQRRVLGALIEHAADAPFLSARELAELAGVSQPSVTRLALVLGFDGYAALRGQLRAPAAPEVTGPGPSRWRRHLDAEADRLRRLADLLPDDATWAEIGAAAAASHPLVIVGLRASRYLASYAAYLARKVHPHVVEVTSGGPDAVDAVVAARADGATTAVVVCMPRYPAATVELAALMDRLGYRQVLVADESVPVLAGVRPAWRLAVPVGSDLTFDSHPGAVVTIGLLLEAVCDAGPAATEARLERLDVAAARSGTYWPGPAGISPSIGTVRSGR